MTARTVVQKYLIGRFPASRAELVERAQRQGADRAVVSRLRTLGADRYDSAGAVEQALGAERH